MNVHYCCELEKRRVMKHTTHTKPVTDSTKKIDNNIRRKYRQRGENSKDKISKQQVRDKTNLCRTTTAPEMHFKFRTRIHANRCPQWKKYCKPTDKGKQNLQELKGQRNLLQRQNCTSSLACCISSFDYVHSLLLLQSKYFSYPNINKINRKLVSIPTKHVWCSC